MFALECIGIENFTVVAFGLDVFTIKKSDEAWSPQTLLSLLAAIEQCPGNTSTEDADAMKVARSILRGSGKGPKMIFVFTDGCTPDQVKLRDQVLRAEEEDIQVIALGIGIDDFGFQGYSQWATAAIPRSLGQAFRYLLSSDIIEVETLEDNQPKGNAQHILKDADEKEWRSMQSKLGFERQSKLIPNSSHGVLSVALAFVVDVTGSMAPHLPIVVHQIEAIFEGENSIAKKMKDAYGWDIFVHASLSSFCDNNRKVHIVKFDPQSKTPHFTDDIEKIKKCLKREGGFFMARGGGDVAEDSAAAFRDVMNIEDWREKFAIAKFLLLITDAPCHGKDFHPTSVNTSLVYYDNKWQDSESSKRALAQGFSRGLENDVATIFCDVDSRNTGATI